MHSLCGTASAADTAFCLALFSDFNDSHLLKNHDIKPTYHSLHASSYSMSWKRPVRQLYRTGKGEGRRGTDGRKAVQATVHSTSDVMSCRALRAGCHRRGTHPSIHIPVGERLLQHQPAAVQSKVTEESRSNTLKPSFLLENWKQMGKYWFSSLHRKFYIFGKERVVFVYMQTVPDFAFRFSSGESTGPCSVELGFFINSPAPSYLCPVIQL